MISIKVQLTPSWPSFASHPEPPSSASSSSPRFLQLTRTPRLGLSTRADTDFERRNLFLPLGDSFQNAFSTRTLPLLASCYRIRCSTNGEHSILPFLASCTYLHNTDLSAYLSFPRTDYFLRLSS